MCAMRTRQAPFPAPNLHLEACDNVTRFHGHQRRLKHAHHAVDNEYDPAHAALAAQRLAAARGHEQRTREANILKENTRLVRALQAVAERPPAIPSRPNFKPPSVRIARQAQENAKRHSSNALLARKLQTVQPAMSAREFAVTASRQRRLKQHASRFKRRIAAQDPSAAKVAGVRPRKRRPTAAEAPMPRRQLTALVDTYMAAISQPVLLASDDPVQQFERAMALQDATSRGLTVSVSAGASGQRASAQRMHEEYNRAIQTLANNAADAGNASVTPGLTSVK